MKSNLVHKKDSDSKSGSPQSGPCKKYRIILHFVFCPKTRKHDFPVPTSGVIGALNPTHADISGKIRAQ